MRRVIAIAVLLLAAGAVQAAGPILRVSIAGKSPHLVGQQVRVDVVVLVPNYFMSSVEIPSMDIPGAVVSMPDQGAQNLNETIGGQHYAGIRRSFTIVPMQEGEFTLPPAKITFRYASAPGKSADGSLSLPPKSFKAELPPGAAAAGGGTAGGAGVLVARVTVKQALDREPGDIKAGETLTRTVEIHARNTQAMVIPPTRFDAPRGVRVYPRDPALSDETGPHGEFLGGKRIDQATYLFDTAGEYALPEIDVAWFDPATGKRENAVAPAIHLSVAPKAAAAPGIATEAEPQVAAPKKPLPWKRWLAWAAIIVLAVLVITLLIRLLRPRVSRWIAARRGARTESEAAGFARLERACRSHDALEAYRALLAWPARGAEIPLDGALQREVGRLESALFASPAERESWNGKPLADALTQARAAARAARVTTRTAALPSLNP